MSIGNNIVVNPIGNIHERIKIIISFVLFATYSNTPVSVIWFEDEHVNKTKLHELYVDLINVIDVDTLKTMNYLYDPKLSTESMISQYLQNDVHGKTFVIETNEEFFSKQQFATIEMYRESRDKMYRKLIDENIAGNLIGIAGCYDYAKKIGLVTECEDTHAIFKDKKNICVLNQELRMQKNTIDFYSFLISLKYLDCIFVDATFMLDEDIREMFSILNVKSITCIV